MRIAICDDDALCREEALAATNEFLARSGHTAAVEVFSHSDDVIDAVEKRGGFDLYILDVVMPHTDGIALGEALRGLGCDGKIIYLTSSDEFALHSYRVKAFDYLLKPIDREKFFSCVTSAAAEISERKGKSVLVKTKDATVKVSLDRILYAALARRAIEYVLTDGKRLESTQIRSSFLEATTDLVADARFFRSGASLVLNLGNITEIGADSLTFKGGETLNFGKKALREIRSAWCEFCLDEVKGK